MRSVNPSYSRFTVALITLAMIAGFSLPMLAQEAPAVHVGYTRITGLPDDWSHHHVVFSNPGTEQQAIKNGTHEQWLKTVNDPRYVMHQLRQNLSVQGPAADDVKIRYRETSEYSDRWGRGERRKHGHPASNSNNTSLHRDWSMSLGSTGGLNPGQYPAKYNFSISSATCNDIVVFPTGVTGVSGGQATIVAYNKLYATTCYSGTQSGPSIAWSYFTQNGGTGTGGNASLSPVISSDGTQIAYIQTVGTAAALVLLTPSASSGGTVATSVTPTYKTPANYPGCTTPCYTTLALGANDTNSAPYYDYDNDVMYVGDNSGVLHKFQNVFLAGTPSEITGGGTGSGWPQTMASAVTLTSPVYDSISGNVFVGSSGGFLYRIPSTGGSTNKVTSARAAFNTAGIVDAPLIDSAGATAKVYIFVGDNSATTPTSQVEYFTPTFSGGASATTSYTVSSVSGSAVGTVLYTGAFDNIHYLGTGGTGNMYVCGVHSTGTQAQLYQIVMSSGTVNTLANTNAASTCSPTTEFLGTNAVTTLGATLTTGTTSFTVASVANIASGDYIQIDSEIMHITALVTLTRTLTVTRAQDGTTAAAHTSGAAVTDITDWVYMSVTAGGNDAACTGACVYSYDVTSGSLPAAATAGINATGGSSGIIIDNSALTTGASQVYYTTLANQACAGNGTFIGHSGNGTGGCAVQATQSGLN